MRDGRDGRGWSADFVHEGRKIRAYAINAAVAEGPHWCAATGTLTWVDISRRTVASLSPDDDLTTIEMPFAVSAAVPCNRGGRVLAGSAGLLLQDRAHALHPLPSPAMDGIRCNDGKCDPAGRFWFGTLGLEGALGLGGLFCLGTDGELTQVEDGFDVCNGLGWSSQGNAFYLVDTIPRALYRYDFDLRTGIVGDRVALVQFTREEGRPDGLAVDDRGGIWCAMWDGWGVQRILPDGSRSERIALPVPRPTSCAFGGPDLTTLYVTTASTGLPDTVAAAAPLSGHLFAIEGCARGVPVAEYCG